MIPVIIFAGLLAVVGYSLGSRGKSPLSPITSGTEPPRVSGNGGSRQTLRHNFQTLQHVLASGQVPNPRLLYATWQEAQATGNTRLMRQVEVLAAKVNLFRQNAINMQAIQAQQAQTQAQEQYSPAPGEQADDEEMIDDSDPDANPEDWGEPVKAEVKMELHDQLNPISLPGVGPISGVEADKWDRFVSAMRTQQADFSNENYKGSFEHNRRRLRQLGIDEGTLSDEQAQYRAFRTDIDKYNTESHKLIQEFAGKTVQVDGQPIVVSPSGVLALLKAAGPRGAENWLKTPSDRFEFPTTTAVFLRCNGCF